MTPEEQIQGIALDVLEQFAHDVVDDIQEKLNNNYPPASKPGEQPHRRSGDLRGGIDYLITVEDSIFTLTIVSSMPYSAALEFKLERPFMAPALENWTPELIRRLQDAFSGPSPVVSPAGAIVPITQVAA